MYTCNLKIRKTCKTQAELWCVNFSNVWRSLSLEALRTLTLGTLNNSPWCARATIILARQQLRFCVTLSQLVEATTFLDSTRACEKLFSSSQPHQKSKHASRGKVKVKKQQPLNISWKRTRKTNKIFRHDPRLLSSQLATSPCQQSFH